jgi:hypothetical protein
MAQELSNTEESTRLRHYAEDIGFCENAQGHGPLDVAMSLYRDPDENEPGE